jgi:hypothetical protein
MKLGCGARLFLLAALAASTAVVAEGLKVGTARVDITPLAAEMPAPFKTVYDRTYVRALVLDNGAARAAIVVLDVPAIQAGYFADLSRRISVEAQVPLPNILLSTSHTHNSIRVDKDGMGVSIPGSEKYAIRTIAATVEAVRQAVAVLQPARAGYGTGKAYLNASRNVWSAEQRHYVVGADRTDAFPVDRTLGVFKFETLSGEPLAFLLNYGIEPVVNIALKSEISGDVPGATARYIEERLGGKPVAIFTVGSIASPAYESRPDYKASRQEREVPHKLMSAMATILGEEALATAAEIHNPSSNLQIGGNMRTLQCPGKTTTPLNLPNQCTFLPNTELPACDFKDKDTEPVDLNLWVLRLGDVALVQADVNVLPTVAEKLKNASPLANTLIVALNYGPMRYVVDDASYILNIYEATATRAKQGCAEQSFIDGALQLMMPTGPAR